MSNIRELLAEGTAALQATSPSPRLDTELLLGGITGLSRAYMVGFGERPVRPEDAEKFRVLLKRRAKNEPIAYLTGIKEFFGLEFEVTADVLIPRPETELMVERAIEYLESSSGIFRVLDLGTGSGCIPVALGSYALKAGRRLEIVAVDRSARALEVARRNAQRNGLTELISFLESDWFGALGQGASFNVILSNPPYIPEGSTERGPETDFEPKSALFSGSDGLRDIRAIFEQIPRYLAPGGLFLCEIGADQGDAVLMLWDSMHPGLPCRKEILLDLAGLTRFFLLERR